MFPFWDLVIAPIFKAVDAKRVVEIGALRGENTVQILDALGPGTELHVIDPLPEFDPAEHEREFPGRYIFHRDLSLNALPDVPPVDVALIDGDHNWYTVYNELKLLAQTAREAGAPLPVMVLHDVAWPYGRRDLYYDPDTIPAEHRQPYAQKGIKMDRAKVLEAGGLNPTMYNAIEEGGPRNGVMTAVEDFIAEYDRPLRLAFYPIYFGLAVVVETERLERQPALAELLDHLESAEGKEDLLRLAERTRLDAMLFQHNVFYHRESWIDRLAHRYLKTLKDALLDEHYLENEVRISHLLDCVERGSQPVPSMLRDPLRQLKDKARNMRAARETGRTIGADRSPTTWFPYTTMGRLRLDHLERCLDEIRAKQLPGDLVECGTGRGGGGVFLRGYLEAWNQPWARVWVADTFRASPRDDGSAAADGDAPPTSGDAGEAPVGEVSWDQRVGELLPDLNNVRDAYDRFDLLDDRVRFLVGELAVTLPEARIDRIALLRVGELTADEARDALEALYDRVVEGGFVVIDRYDDPRVQEVVDRFRAERGITDELSRVDWSAVAWTKSKPAPAPAEQERPTEERQGTARANAPLAPPIAAVRKDLTVVVVFYNMKREAARTLHSLSRAYQKDVDDLDYEVIVVENGSDPDQVLGEDYVKSFGPEFRYLDLGDEADPSPVKALNLGIQRGAGQAFALMIDGAHVLTPRVLHYGMVGLETYAPAIVGTQQWYVGPGQQGDVLADGYDQELEDQLFEHIGWPADGYRLFDVGHFVGDRDWFDGLWESNCLFVPRAVLAQSGAFDESFDVPGGGYANLELYERLGSTPGVTAVTILGEGSFHQNHGGTTTNQPDIAERNRRLASYAEHYAELRGRPFKGLDKEMHYVGSMSWEACRTRARRRVAPRLFKRGAPGDPDGRPTKPTPIPEDLNTAYVDAYWRSFKWKEISWLGHRVAKPPTDLVAYQEIVSEVRPDWIIVTSNGGPPARGLFFASLCDLVGHGQVISIDPKATEEVDHPRLTYVSGAAHEPEIVEQVHALTGHTNHALAVLGTMGGRLRMIQEFEAYEPLISVGSYIVVENTIVNGRPVWPSFGLGPAEAVRQLLVDHRDFAADTTIEKRCALTFNPSGYLKRVR